MTNQSSSPAVVFYLPILTEGLDIYEFQILLHILAYPEQPLCMQRVIDSCSLNPQKLQHAREGLIHEGLITYVGDGCYEVREDLGDSAEV